MDGDAQLDAILERIRSLGGLAEEAARAAAPLVEAAAKRTAAAGTTPSGEAWAPKKDGGRALAHAADAVSASAAGPTITITLADPEAWHQRGVGTHTPKRQVIPEAGDDLPPQHAAAIEQGTRQAFQRLTGGA